MPVGGVAPKVAVPVIVPVPVVFAYPPVPFSTVQVPARLAAVWLVKVSVALPRTVIMARQFHQARVRHSRGEESSGRQRYEAVADAMDDERARGNRRQCCDRLKSR